MIMGGCHELVNLCKLQSGHFIRTLVNSFQQSGFLFLSNLWLLYEHLDPIA